MWFGSHLPHLKNAVCGLGATYLIVKMRYVAWQPLTSFTKSHSPPEWQWPDQAIYDIGTKILIWPSLSHNSTQKAPPELSWVRIYMNFCVDYESDVKTWFKPIFQKWPYRIRRGVMFENLLPKSASEAKEKGITLTKQHKKRNIITTQLKPNRETKNNTNK